MKLWWQHLAPRERQILTLGAIIVAVFLLYRLLWLPLTNRTARIEAQVVSGYQTLAWMRQASAEITSLQGSATIHASTVNPLVAAQETAARLGLDKQMTRLDTQGGNIVQVRMENAPLDSVLSWMQTLGRQYGLTVDRVVMEPQPGQVNRINATLAIRQT
jgi:general secretion pathway protein M